MKFFIPFTLLLCLFFLPGCSSKADRARALFDRAGKTEELRERIPLYEKAVQTDPSFVNAYWMLARTLVAMDPPDYDRALSCWERVVEIAPFWGDAWYNRGRLHGLLKRDRAALEDFSRALSRGVKHPDLYFNRAFVLFRTGAAEEALENFKNAVRLSRDDTESMLWVGICEAALGNPGEAVREFTRVLQTKPEAPFALLNRGVCRFRLERHPESIEDFTAAAVLLPDHFAPLFYRSRALRLSGRADAALRDLDVLVERFSDHGPFYAERARTRLELQDPDSALADLRAFSELQPKNAPAYFWTGKILFDQNDRFKAASLFARFHDLAPSKHLLEETFPEIYAPSIEKLLQSDSAPSFPLSPVLPCHPPSSLRPPRPLDPDYYDRYIGRLEGSLEKTRKMEKQASGVFKSAKIVSDLLESDSPASPRARSCKTPSLWFALFLVLTFGLLAGVYFYLRRPRVSAFEYYRRAEQAKTPEEKIRFFTRALQADPYFRMAYYNRARVRKETGDHRGALKDLNKLVRVAADFGEGYRLRGILFKETGELEKAKDDFKKAASLKDSIYHISRGISKIKAGDFENAREEFDRAIEKNPEQAVAFSNRGIARVHCGDLEGAIEDYSIAIRLQPDNTAALQNRAQAYEKTGDLESAENDRRLIEVINESKAGGDSSSSPRENGPKRDADVPGESG